MYLPVLLAALAGLAASEHGPRQAPEGLVIPEQYAEAFYNQVHGDEAQKVGFSQSSCPESKFDEM